VAVPETELDDLRDRLARTRWAEAETVDDWSQGVPRAYVHELCRYWAQDYDWRPVEARLNAAPQFTTRIDGLPIHFLHTRSPPAGALPLLITHGWPGSVVEFLKVIGPLVDPAATPPMRSTSSARAGASSARLCWESYRRPDWSAIDVPTGLSVFPKEIFPISRRWAQLRFRDLRHYHELDRGGRFAAFERPDVFVDELRTFFRHVRRA
jgi:pimeloyl-ACP methyl ester carboxylesterase